VKVAYYKGCLASMSAKELDTSTQALAPQLGIELEELLVVQIIRAHAVALLQNDGHATSF